MYNYDYAVGNNSINECLQTTYIDPYFIIHHNLTMKIYIKESPEMSLWEADAGIVMRRLPKGS